MPIGERTRKALWARSGNRCAICRQILIVDGTADDRESVVGEECHIVSGSPRGPRFDPQYSSGQVDDISNLLLLCGTHHKMVDDQFETYSVDVLRTIRANHEEWVESRLKTDAASRPVRLRRLRENIPVHLLLMRSGRRVIAMASSCYGMYPGYPDDLSGDEVELVGGFLQKLKDYMDLSSDLEPVDEVHASVDLDNELEALARRGFLVFTAVEEQIIEGGVGPSSPFPFLHVAVVRDSDSSIDWATKGTPEGVAPSGESCGQKRRAG